LKKNPLKSLKIASLVSNLIKYLDNFNIVLLDQYKPPEL